MNDNHYAPEQPGGEAAGQRPPMQTPQYAPVQMPQYPPAQVQQHPPTQTPQYPPYRSAYQTPPPYRPPYYAAPYPAPKPKKKRMSLRLAVVALCCAPVYGCGLITAAQCIANHYLTS